MNCPTCGSNMKMFPFPGSKPWCPNDCDKKVKEVTQKKVHPDVVRWCIQKNILSQELEVVSGIQIKISKFSHISVLARLPRYFKIGAKLYINNFFCWHVPEIACAQAKIVQCEPNSDDVVIELLADGEE